MEYELIVMVIDDNETDNLISSRIIEIGLKAPRISCFTSARKALAFLESHSRDHHLLPDLIFLDIEMPMMSGPDFLAELEIISNQLEKDPKVVMLSAYERATDKNLKSPRILDYLPKPLSPDAVAKVVKELSALRLKVA